MISNLNSFKSSLSLEAQRQKVLPDLQAITKDLEAQLSSLYRWAQIKHFTGIFKHIFDLETWLTANEILEHTHLYSCVKNLKNFVNKGCQGDNE